jgi:hypothetical protein
MLRLTAGGDVTENEARPVQAEIVPEGHWREDGTFEAPEGWPEGAGWVVKNADGSIDQWGPASDLMLVAQTDVGQDPLPPASQLGIELKGIPQPEDPAE